MSDVTTTSTLAQMLFAGKPAINFAHVVRELDAALGRYPSTHRTLTWDCDDLATFELEGVRIVLSYADDLEGLHGACLTVGVGPGPGASAEAPSLLAKRRPALCRKITDRLASRYAIDALLWHETERPVTPDLVDELLDRLDDQPLLDPLAQGTDVDRLLARMSDELNATDAPLPMHFARPDTESELGPVLLFREASQPPETPPANDRPDLPRLFDPANAAIREALYATDESAATGNRAPSTQMRLAVHAMNATMLVVFAPIGLAAMAHGIVRGEDMRRSAQLMAVMGLFAAALGGHGSLHALPFL